MRLPLEGTLLEGSALDLEQRGDEVQAVACDGVAESRGFDEAAARVGHATRAR